MNRIRAKPTHSNTNGCRNEKHDETDILNRAGEK